LKSPDLRSLRSLASSSVRFACPHEVLNVPRVFLLPHRDSTICNSSAVIFCTSMNKPCLEAWRRKRLFLFFCPLRVRRTARTLVPGRAIVPSFFLRPDPRFVIPRGLPLLAFPSLRIFDRVRGRFWSPVVFFRSLVDIFLLPIKIAYLPRCL